MQLKRVMTKGVELINPDTTLQEAASRMRAQDVGMLPIGGGDGRLIGTVTDRDMAVRGIAEGCDPNRTKVRDVMTPDVCCCYEDQDVEEAVRLMQERQIRRLIILDRNDRPVGVLSLGDLATHRQTQKVAERTLEKVSKGAHSH